MTARPSEPTPILAIIEGHFAALALIRTKMFDRLGETTDEREKRFLRAAMDFVDKCKGVK